MSIGNVARVCCALALIALAACASGPPKPAATKLAIIAAADVNPDSQGRASPVVVRLFQLRTDAEFAGAQFFQLYDGEKEALGAGLISRDEYTLLPGQDQRLVIPVAPDTRFFGVLAAYRDPAAKWRAIAPASKKGAGGAKPDRVSVRLGKTAVTLAINE